MTKNDKIKALTEENRHLWAENTDMTRGLEEMRAMYDAVILRAVMAAGAEADGEWRLEMPPVDVALLDRYELHAQRREDGQSVLTVREKGT